MVSNRVILLDFLLMKKKGVKARKKRLAGGGGGGGSAGTYPMSVDNAGPSADNAFGIMSIDHGSATTQSGLTHGSLSISSIIDMNVDPEDPSAMIAPFTGPTIQIADYVATDIPSKRGSGNHSTTLIQGAIGSATYVGSTYLSIKVT
jgi:hypothetical protein